MPAVIGDIRLADIVTFVAARRRGSINAVAREFGVTASQVSKAITRVERHLGMPLLARTSKGISVHPDAVALVPQLEDLLARIQALQRPHPPTGRRLTVAAPSYLLPFFLRVAARTQPEVRLRGLQLAPSLVRAVATEDVFDLALSIGLDRLPDAWIRVQVGELRKGVFAQPRVARSLGKGPLASERLRLLPFIIPTYQAEGQFVPMDDGCPLSVGERTLGHEVQTIGLALDLACVVPCLVFGPVLAAQPFLATQQLVEIPVEGWYLTEPVFLASNLDRVRATEHRTLVDEVGRALALANAPPRVGK